MSVYKKLMEVRVAFNKLNLKKTGYNKFAGYHYFELSDFLPAAQQLFYDHGLCGIVSFAQDVATLSIVSFDDNTGITITSPMSSASLKGCHDVQNLGAVETYLRRYLWGTALEMVEQDAIDSTTGKTTKGEKCTITPTTGAWEQMDEEEQKFLLSIAEYVIECLYEGRVNEAVEYLESQNLQPEEKVALWTRLDSKQRSAIKKVHDEKKKVPDQSNTD